MCYFFLYLFRVKHARNLHTVPALASKLGSKGRHKKTLRWEFKNAHKARIVFVKDASLFFLLTMATSAKREAERSEALRLLPVMVPNTKSKLDIKSNSSLDERLKACINLLFLPFFCWNHQIWYNFNASTIFKGANWGQENIRGNCPMPHVAPPLFIHFKIPVYNIYHFCLTPVNYPTQYQ